MIVNENQINNYSYNRLLNRNKTKKVDSFPFQFNFILHNFVNISYYKVISKIVHVFYKIINLIFYYVKRLLKILIQFSQIFKKFSWIIIILFLILIKIFAKYLDTSNILSKLFKIIVDYFFVALPVASYGPYIKLELIETSILIVAFVPLKHSIFRKMVRVASCFP